MLDIRWIRENPDRLVRALASRGSDEAAARATVDGLVGHDEARRGHLVSLQEKQERRNQASKEIGNAMRSGDMELADRLKQEVADIKSFVQSGEARERELDKALADALANLPNIPLEDVPQGADEKDNVEVRRVGEPRRMNWAKEHFEIGEALGLMDFERAAKLSGSRFTVLSGKLARLERALGQFMLDLHTGEHGYTEVQPPLLVRDEAMYGTAQLPKFADDLFAVTRRLTDEERDSLVDELAKREYGDLNPERGSRLLTYMKLLMKHGELAPTIDRHWLVPTAEVPLTNLVREEILAADTLPRRYTALTPCFRSEAGSAGRDTRGMLRQHQFYKVELVSITDEDASIAEHERMTAAAEEVLKRLGLPYRVVVLCTGDMGFASRKTYDIEVWLPGQGAYREISSCSVCGDFQARRMNARYRGADGKPRFVHTLNGSGVAVGRALIAVMENYQNEDGSITVPEVLRPYMGGTDRIDRS